MTLMDTHPFNDVQPIPDARLEVETQDLRPKTKRWRVVVRQPDGSVTSEWVTDPRRQLDTAYNQLFPKPRLVSASKTTAWIATTAGDFRIGWEAMQDGSIGSVTVAPVRVDEGADG